MCDRFYDSTTAYQGGGRDLATLDWLERLHHHATGGLVPDRTFLLDVPLAVAAQRRAGRGAPDRMEAGGGSFFERVRDAYLVLVDLHPDRFLVLDGTHDPDTLHEQIVLDVTQQLKRSV